MFKVDYEYLNDKLLNMLEELDNTYFLENIDLIKEFLNDYKKLINKYNLEQTEKYSHLTLDLIETYKIIKSYIDKYLKEYKEIINTRLSDGSINFSFNKDSSFSYCSFDGINYDINIFLEHNEKDPGIIIHEIMHSLNYKEKNELAILFSESISIFFELDIYKYMNSIGYNINIDEIIKEKLINNDNTINLLNDTLYLIDIIKNNGFINEKTFDNMNDIKKSYFYDELDFNYFLYNYENFLKNIDDINIINGFSYILGTFLALSSKSNDDISRFKFKLLNNSINSIEINEVFDILNYNLKDKEQFKKLDNMLKNNKLLVKKK